MNSATDGTIVLRERKKKIEILSLLNICHLNLLFLIFPQEFIHFVMVMNFQKTSNLPQLPVPMINLGL